MKQKIYLIKFLFLIICCLLITSCNIKLDNEDEDMDQIVDIIYFTVSDEQIPVKLEKNSTTQALVELLKKGDITYTASDYGGFEKVGALGYDLPHSDQNVKTNTGDVVLYLGNQIVIFYGSNSWSYTKLGKMVGYSDEKLKTILTKTKDATIKISLIKESI